MENEDEERLGMTCILSLYESIFFSEVFSTPSLTPYASESSATQAAQNMENNYPLNDNNECRSMK
jgi:hypothetical protein